MSCKHLDCLPRSAQVCNSHFKNNIYTNYTCSHVHDHIHVCIASYPGLPMFFNIERHGKAWVRGYSHALTHTHSLAHIRRYKFACSLHCMDSDPSPPTQYNKPKHTHAINAAILGLTVLAVGNSVADWVADSIVARKGKPEMALASCFGAPLITHVMGLSFAIIVSILQS